MMPKPDLHEIFRAEALDLGRADPIPSTELRDIEVGGERIHVLAWADAPASVVLIHGAALNAYAWVGTLSLWPGDVSAVAIDLPGHGRSTWRESGDYSPGSMATVLDAVIAQLQTDGLLVEEPAVVGHSLGGLTALASQGFAQGEWSSLTLVDILPLPPDGARTVAQFLKGPKVFASREEITEKAWSFGLGGSRSRLERAVYLNTTETEGGVRWRHHLGQLGAAGLQVAPAEASWDALAQGATPLALVRGDTGFIDDGLLATLEQARPDVPVITLSGGHNLHEDAPGCLAQVLADVIAAGA